jgi:hypothetical protein
MSDEPANEQTALDFLICVRDDLCAKLLEAEDRLRTAGRDHAEALRQATLASEQMSKMERLLNPLRKVSPVTMEFKLEISRPLSERFREYMQACRAFTARPKVLEPGITILHDIVDEYRRALAEVETLLAAASPPVQTEDAA